MRRYKGIICSEPGVGKSTFALMSPSPFFICTDENYQYLEDLGADPADHVRVYNWQQAKKAFLDAEKDTTHQTIVVDLFDDLHSWAEMEYAKSKGKESIMDLNDYGKSLNIVKNDFVSSVERLLSLDKNILLIMHGHYIKIRDKYGNETTRFETSGRMKEKVLEEITGKVCFCLKAFAVTQKGVSGKIEVKRWLSLSPSTENEFGVLRGIDTEICPKEIPLDWNAFVTALEEYKLKPIINRDSFKDTPTPKVETPKQVVLPEKPTIGREVKLESLVEPDDDPTMNVVAEAPKVATATFTPKVETPKVEAPKAVPTKEEKKMSIDDLVSKLKLNK